MVGTSNLVPEMDIDQEVIPFERQSEEGLHDRNHHFGDVWMFEMRKMVDRHGTFFWPSSLGTMDHETGWPLQNCSRSGSCLDVTKNQQLVLDLLANRNISESMQIWGYPRPAWIVHMYHAYWLLVHPICTRRCRGRGNGMWTMSSSGAAQLERRFPVVSNDGFTSQII